MGSKKIPEITYGAIGCSNDGVLYSSQSAAGRSKKTALIVRHSKPGAPADIVYEHGSKLQTLWVSPQGHCHASSSDGFHHSNESGSWRKTRVTKEKLLGLGGVGETLFGSTYKGQLFTRRRDGEWREILVGGAPAGTSWFNSFGGSSEDDIYATSDSEVIHFDGTAWTKLKTPASGPKSVVVVSKDEVYIASYSGLARGQRNAFALVAKLELQHSARFKGEVYCASSSTGVLRWTNGALTKVAHEPMSIYHMEAGSFLCTTGHQQGIYTYDGKAWTVTKSH